MDGSIDETIDRVEQLYFVIKGQRPPPLETRAAIPPESDPIAHVEEQIGQLIGAAEQLVAMPRMPTWVPRAVVWRDDAGLLLALDLSGVSRDQIEITLQRGVITVAGRRQTPWSRTAAPRAVEDCEVPFGSFSRSFAIGAPVASEQVSARLEQGVLTIRVSHVGDEPSQIAIRA